jgi:hypothetical protein
MSREAYADIWRRGMNDEQLSGDDAAFFDAMRLHPEYYDYWERAAQLGDSEVLVDGVNPFLHVALHCVIERQIADRTPPETDQTLFRLTRTGMDRHSAMHRILHVFTQLFWHVLKEKEPFDMAAYRRHLRALKP